MTMPAEPPSTVDPEIVERARANEPDRYLSALLSPLPVRADLLALVAFTADLARIPSVVTEPMMGEIRLQWWRDQFGPLAAGAATAHPLADALGRAIRTHDLPVPLLTAMTEARAFDLYVDPLPDDAALDAYIVKTEAIPFELALRILGVDEAVAGRLAQPAGRAFGLARLAAALPAHWSAGRPVLPATWFDTAATSADAQLTASDPAGATRLVEALLAASATALAAVGPQIALLSRRQRTGLLPLSVIGQYASAARAQAAAGMRERRLVSPVSRILRLASAHMRGKF